MPRLLALSGLLVALTSVGIFGCHEPGTQAANQPGTGGSSAPAPAPSDSPQEKPAVTHASDESAPSPSSDAAAESALATFGGGCFWCVEAVFEELKGVLDVESGYAGGKVLDPTYEQVCTGATGHAEVCQIRYDPRQVSFDKLLEVFFRTHDPTTLNRQGNDVGTQYRSVVFYHSDQQREKAEHYIKKLNEAKAYPNPIVTEVSPAPRYYAAEAYHQDYFRRNPGQGYCQFVIQPKMEKFRKVFGEDVRKAD